MKKMDKKNSTVEVKKMDQNMTFLPTDTLSRMLMGWFDANAGVQREEAPVCLGPLPTEPTDCQSQLLLGWFSDRAQDPEMFLEPQPTQALPTDCLSQMLMGWFDARKNEKPQAKKVELADTPAFNSLLTAYQELCNGSGKTYIPVEWLKTWFSLPLLASQTQPQAQAGSNGNGKGKSALLADLDQQLAAFGLRTVESAFTR